MGGFDPYPPATSRGGGAGSTSPATAAATRRREWVRAGGTRRAGVDGLRGYCPWALDRSFRFLYFFSLLSFLFHLFLLLLHFCKMFNISHYQYCVTLECYKKFGAKRNIFNISFKYPNDNLCHFGWCLNCLNFSEA